MKWLQLAGCVLSMVILAGCQTINLGTNSTVATAKGDPEETKIEATFSKSELLFSSARKFEKAGQIEEAIKLYEKAAVASKHDKKSLLEANRHLAILYDLSDQSEKAKQAFRNATEGIKPDADLLNDHGYFLLKQNEFEEALSVLTAASEQYPANKRIANNLGMALVASGKVEDGFRVFESSVGRRDAIANVGAILMQQGRTEEGKTWLEQVADSSDSKNKASKILKVATRAAATR